MHAVRRVRVICIGNRIMAAGERHLCIITMSVDYADYLRETLPAMRDVADVVFVITTADDRETREVAAAASGGRGCECEVVLYPRARLRAGGAVFNKSGLLRSTQSAVHNRYPDSWVLLLDSDIALVPPGCSAGDVRSSILDGCTDEGAMYCIARYDFADAAVFRELGSDFRNGEGYPCLGAGYFQLYFDKSALYPPHSHDCSRCDVEFAMGFHGRGKLRVLPGVVGHLGEQSVNWRGRRSGRWSLED